MIPLLNLKEKIIFEENLHIRFSFAHVAKMGKVKTFAFFAGKNSKVQYVVRIRLLRFFNNSYYA